MESSLLSLVVLQSLSAVFGPYFRGRHTLLWLPLPCALGFGASSVPRMATRRSFRKAGLVFKTNKQTKIYPTSQKPPESTLHSCVAHRALEQVVQRGCGVFLLGDVKELSGHNPVLGRLDQMTHCDAFQPDPPCDSVFSGSGCTACKVYYFFLICVVRREG